MDFENETLEPLEPPVKKKKYSKGSVILALFFGTFLGMAIAVIVLVFVTRTSIKSIDESTSDVMEGLQSESTAMDPLSDSTNKLQMLTYIINNYYYKDVETKDLINGIYKGLLESLDDPYSAYYTAEEYEDLMQSLTGNYAGIGALLQKNNETGVVTITKVYKKTPAEKAGLKEGDIIFSADGFLGTDMALDEFVQHIRGEEGSDVELVIVRDEQELTFTCTRENIATPTVEHQMLAGNVGYIQVSQFTDHTYDDFVEAYEDLEKQGMEKVIFDMRNNGGGLLDSVVDMLDYLLPEGTVVYTMDKAGAREDFTSSGRTKKTIPMVVLVNENTASAAEIFTGAIRDFKYGTIIGTTTFGKGIVQSTIPLEDGSAVKLTTQTYYTPNGECIHGKGITPDIELEYKFGGEEGTEYTVDLDNQIQKALEVLSE